MKAIVLEKAGEVRIRNIDIEETPGAADVRISIKAVGICGSDVHYYKHGRIGPYIVNKPMVLGHEASGIINEVGSGVTHLKVGDRVCMEPGIPKFNSKATLSGMYNLDPELTFWATPPIHGCLRTSVVHPAALTYTLPENVSFEEGSMVEPLAIGLQAASKAGIKAGDKAVVLGAGTIGVMTALSALASGCSEVFITDTVQEKLDLLSKITPVKTINITKTSIQNEIERSTNSWGADVVFDATGNESAIQSAFDIACPGGTLVLIGCPLNAVRIDILKAQSKELTLKTVFRYANVYQRALALIAGGKINVKPLITAKYSFTESLKAFEDSLKPAPSSIKSLILF